MSRVYAIFRNYRCWVAIGGRDAGGGDGLAGFFAAGDFEVQGEEPGEEVLFGIEAVGVEDGGVEGSVGVFERGSAGEFEGAVEGAQAAGNLGEGVSANRSVLAARPWCSLARRV